MAARALFKRWLIALAAVIVLIVTFYGWLDLPIATWVHDNLTPYDRAEMYGPIAHIYNPLIPLAFAVLLIVGFRALIRRPFTKVTAVAFAAALSVIVTQGIKTLLKYIFGRTGPDTIMATAWPDWLTGGFNWFYKGASSFPSGHMATLCAVLAVLWLCYPRGKQLYLTAALAIAVVLIAANFHFVSDVIAGAFLGASVALWITQAIDSRLKICVRQR